MFKEKLENVRKVTPLIHNITNYVTVNDVANVLLACGGSPIMSDDIEDAPEITSICGGLNINIGTLNQNTIKAMFAAGKKAQSLNHPILLDPVGVGASLLRTKTAFDLISQIHFDVIRGNISEIKTLIYGRGSTHGVDANMADVITDDNLDLTIKILKKFAAEQSSIIAVTGKIDLVCDSQRCFVIRNGRQEMSSITGTGCQLSGLMTAYITANPDDKLVAAAAAVILMGYAGEVAWNHMLPGDGNATYRNRIIDAIYNIGGSELEAGAKYEIR